jgi:hypothetical protein
VILSLSVSVPYFPFGNTFITGRVLTKQGARACPAHPPQRVTNLSISASAPPNPTVQKKPLSRPRASRADRGLCPSSKGRKPSAPGASHSGRRMDITLKIGAINFYPTTGKITRDTAPRKYPERGLPALLHLQWHKPGQCDRRPTTACVDAHPRRKQMRPFFTGPVSFLVKSYPARQSRRQTKSSLASTGPDQGVAPPTSQ